MAIDPELLEILVCPKTHGALEVVQLPEEVQRALIEKYREHFRDEEPVAEQGLLCRESERVYPVVSDIPIMIEEEALAASVLEPSAAAADD
ncbi:MAG: Trm112 family protein [Acidobacteriota bacterium]